MTAGKLDNRTILLVEDDFFQAEEIRVLLEQEGAQVVGPTGRVEDVPALLTGRHVDAALLDINLGTGASFDTAHLLQSEGVPFAFLTGYDQSALPADLASTPRLEKPADERKVINLLTTLL